jgi:hypothetical protein
MRTSVIAAILALMLAAGVAYADVDVTVDPGALNLGYMNVFNLPPPDGDGAFQFGGPWGFVDLTAVYSGNELTLGPNTIGDPNEYWYQCVGGAVPPDCGGPGAPGNKIMEANSYAEVLDGSLAGQTVTFSGEVTAYSLTDAHTVIAFVKDFAGDFSSFEQNTVPLTETGTFTVSLTTINDPTRVVQWGFQMVGVNVWVTDVDPFGSITIAPEAVPAEPTRWKAIKSMYR